MTRNGTPFVYVSPATSCWWQPSVLIEAIVIFVSCGLLGHPLRVETMADGKILEVVWASSWFKFAILMTNLLKLQSFDDKIAVGTKLQWELWGLRYTLHYSMDRPRELESGAARNIKIAFWKITNEFLWKAQKETKSWQLPDWIQELTEVAKEFFCKQIMPHLFNSCRASTRRARRGLGR